MNNHNKESTCPFLAQNVSTHFFYGFDKSVKKSQCSAVEYLVSTSTIFSQNPIQSLARSVIAELLTKSEPESL